MSDLNTLIAPLFVPANRPERFVKAAASEADAVIIDLEDAVPVDAKDAARAALREAALAKPLIVRINAVGTAWHVPDCAALTTLPVAAIMLPKAERIADLDHIRRIAPVVALIETAQGVAAAREIARSGLAARLAFGSIDYAVDIGCDHTHAALAAARTELVLASRLGGLPAPLDGVTAAFDAPATLAEDVEMARSLGFGGKLLIHPAQAKVTLEGFRPSAEAIAWARRVLDTGDGATKIDGMMIDEPVRARARNILKRAG
ncbi:CoA ester lyase [Sphingomonas oligophenolica]|uniref:CoA ester lyase n=1 Tax=Sphingomonas oligophenolica TaxID=301154 RepID=A0ABU9Y6E4_9SPHN